MNLVVAHGAGLVLRGLIVRRPRWPLSREGMALQAEHVHRHHFEQPRIGRTVRRVATGATFGLDRHVLVDEWPLLVDVALVTDEIATRQGP